MSAALKQPILDAMSHVGDALAYARAEPRREGLIEKLKIAERQLAVCLGEVEDVTPARFAQGNGVQHPDYPEDAPMDALDNTQCLNDHPFSGAVSAGDY